MTERTPHDLREEVDALRATLRGIAKDLDNGSAISERASTEFHRLVRQEVKLVIDALKVQVDIRGDTIDCLKEQVKNLAEQRDAAKERTKELLAAMSICSGVCSQTLNSSSGECLAVKCYPDVQCELDAGHAGPHSWDESDALEEALQCPACRAYGFHYGPCPRK